MTEEYELIREVARRLSSAGIEYMMTGSMAMALFGTPRMTRDIDVIVQLSMADANAISGLFRDGFYIDETAVREAIRARGMFDIIHNESVTKVDFIVLKDDEYRLEEFSRRVKVDTQDGALWVVTLEDLVLSKLVWARQSGSEMQLRDARQLLAHARGRC
jgi:hypothetical protein